MNPLNKYEHLIGQRFDSIIVVGPEEIVFDKDMNELYRNIYVDCDCGKKYALFRADSVEKGLIHSCGCGGNNMVSAAETPSTGHVTHGDSKRGPYHPLYVIWKNTRTKVGHDKTFKLFGIKFSEEWNDWNTFKEWAISQGWVEGMKLYRHDETADFDPNNCYLY